MSVSNEQNVVASFSNRRDAERAIEELHRNGFSDDQIGVAFHDQGHHAESGGSLTPGDTKVEEGAAGGAATGGVIGGVIGAAATGVIPGIGPIIAAGTLASILGGAAAGAAAGGLFGSVVGLGVTEEEARFYEQEFNQGSELVAVRVDGRQDEAIDILLRNDGRFANDRMANRTPRGRQAQEPVSDPDRDVDRTATGGPTTDERPARRESNVGGVERENTETVRGDTTTPREGRTTTEQGRTFTPSGATGGHVARDREVSGHDEPRRRSWDESRDTYRSDFETRFAGSGRQWEEAEPGYRYAHEMANDPRYQGRRWEEVEPELRQGYGEWYVERRYTRETDDRAGSLWAGVEENIRDTWNSIFGSDEDRGERYNTRDTESDWRSSNP